MSFLNELEGAFEECIGLVSLDAFDCSVCEVSRSLSHVVTAVEVKLVDFLNMSDQKHLATIRFTNHLILTPRGCGKILGMLQACGCSVTKEADEGITNM